MSRSEHEKQLVQEFLERKDLYRRVPERGTVRISTSDGVLLHAGEESLISWAKRSRFEDKRVADRAEALRRLGSETELEQHMRDGEDAFRAYSRGLRWSNR